MDQISVNGYVYINIRICNNAYSSMGIAMLDKNIIAGLFFIALGIFFLIGSIYKAKKVYKKLKGNN